MSRIRVYELAKEAGMSGKELADKLVELGFDIKGHSSSVDDETAARIRSALRRAVVNEKLERRVPADSGVKESVVRRKTTVIRRRPAAAAGEELGGTSPGDDLQVSSSEPPADDSATPPPTVESLPSVDVTAVVESASGDTAKEQSLPVLDEKEVQSPLSNAHELEDGHVAAEAVETLPTSKEDAVAAVVAEDDLASEEGSTGPESHEPVVRESTGPQITSFARPEKKDKKLPPRKAMARVVRTIELPQVVEEEGDPRQRKKPGKPLPAKRPAQPAVADPVAQAAADEASRAKKKGKKGFETEAEKEAEFRRGAKKGQKNVKFTHFAQDYLEQDGSGRRGKRSRRAPKVVTPPSEMKASKKRFKIFETISVGELAQRMKIKASEVIAKLMGLGVMATINQLVDVETATLIAADFGYEVEQGITEEIGVQMLQEAEEGGERQLRPPVVTVMGHVDHGKTSILDAIRKTDVALGEAGGITQHIGAYHVRAASGDVTFVDTPGHAAFTEMRSRGAQVTDIVVLVVAADDGVMDQTREAINHAQAANVPIIVAVNKIDKENADIDRVKRELSDLNLMPEDWGGQTMYCQTSAKKNIGIDNLLDSIQVLAEVLELRADETRKARGRVIEAQLHKGRGPVATVLIQEGTLRLGEYFVVGQFSGKVRAMLDDKGRKIKEAGPAIPVEVQGLSGVPSAGDEFLVVTDEKMARSVSQVRALKARESELGATSKISLDRLFEQMNEGDVQELRVVLRADVQGTLEAFAKAAEDLSTKSIKVKVLHEGTGTITESDILLASASDAIIIGFNVRPTVKVKELAVRENVDVRSYDVIYHALDDIRKAMVGMLEPTFEEQVIGLAEVRETFSVPKVGTIAGCAVLDGKITRTAKVRVVRDGVVIYTGRIDSLRRFKDDVREVLSGFECGIGVEKFNDIKIGDNLEAFVMNEVEATL
jgi:translation initiation factor IF-2